MMEASPVAACVVLNQPVTLIASVVFSDCESPQEIELAPLKLNAPKLPVGPAPQLAVPVTVPVLPFPVLSAAVVPEPSLKRQLAMRLEQPERKFVSGP